MSTLSPYKEPTRFLTFAYIAALALIAALAVGSHRIIAHALQSQRESTETVYLAARQRMLAQNILLYAFNYDHFHLDKDHDRLEDSNFDFQTGHDYLTRILTPQGEVKPRPMSRDIYEIYFLPPYNLDQEAHDFLQAAKTFAAFQPDDPEDIRVAALRTVSNLGTGALTANLDKAVYSYESETLHENSRLDQIQFGMSLFIISILLLEAGIIFSPLVRHVRHYSQMLLTLALRNSLTGLDNRHAFMERVNLQLLNEGGNVYPLCVAMADIDRFKSINDTHGHAVGDKVLQHFADIFRKALRTHDVIGRIGGEEFALLLPHTGADDGLATLERIRKMAEESPCTYTVDGGVEKSLHYTVSLGMLAVASPGPDVANMLRQADKALYEAKANGRNRVVRYMIGFDDEPAREGEGDHE